MKQYEVTGMSCAACSARVEKAVSKVPGVTSCSVSLLTNSMGVEGTATDQEIVNAVVAAGYGAAPKGAKKEQAAAEEEEALKDHETPKLRKRLIASVIFLVVLMYFSMGHMMWGWPVPAAMKDNHVAMGLLQMLLTIIIMVINQKFFVSGFTSLLHGAPNMDTLVALGAGASFGYSTYALFAMTGAQVRGDMDAVMGYMHEFYFESAAMILTLITVLKEPDAAGTEDCDRSAGWEGSYRVDHRSAAGGYLCRASGRKHSGRWDCPRGKQCGQRGSTHRRKYSGRQTERLLRQRGNDEPVRVPAL